MQPDNPFLMSTEWLASKLDNPSVKIVDASWYLPDQNRNGRAEYLEGHIPGAVFFDIDAIADTSSGLPHMLPTPEFFAEKVGAMGICERDTIVIYDGAGLFSAPRVWWTFRVFGAQNVFILDGGMPAWRADNHPVEQGLAHPKSVIFNAVLDTTKIKSKTEMSALIEAGDVAIADARPEARYAGTVPEPRPGLRGGHMPGARSVPSSLFVRDGRLISKSEIESVFQDRGVDLKNAVVTSCGSGVTAAILTLALETIDHTNNALYDGSWAEWGLPGDHPVVLGAQMPKVSPTAKPRYLKAHITELEMNARPLKREPLPYGQKVALMRTSGITPAFYRYLYAEVGKPHHWFIRRGLSDEQLTAVLRYGQADVWVLYVDGCPAGYFEINTADMPKYADIQYLGLMPEYQGRGLSRFLISEAIHAAWDKNPERICIQTNTLDNQRAVILYQKAGFSAVGSYDELIEAWD